MKKLTDLNLPDSHYRILQVVAAMAWADGNLSEAEIKLLIEQFKADLPVDPHPIFYAEDTTALFGSFVQNPPISKQLQERIDAELAFREIIDNYKYHPQPLADLVSQLKTQEDRCLAVKLAYMVIKASPDPENEDNLISQEEKKSYSQLLDLVNLQEDLVNRIEKKAEQELDYFQHPFTAFVANVKHFLHLD